MSDIKWIKITTNIFDDEKMKIIDTMPARDEILVIWFKLLCLSGKVNENGLLFMSNKIAYTPEMLAAIFNRELSTVKLALSTFQGFGMIEVEDNEIISISNWEKHQNIEGMEKIREQNRIRQQKHREKKQLSLSSNVTSRDSNAIEEDKEDNKIKSRNIINIPSGVGEDLEFKLKEFIDYRKQIKKPLKTNRPIDAMVKGIGSEFVNEEHLIQCIDFTMDHEWQGVKSEYIKYNTKIKDEDVPW